MWAYKILRVTKRAKFHAIIYIRKMIRVLSALSRDLVVNCSELKL